MAAPLCAKCKTSDYVVPDYGDEGPGITWWCSECGDYCPIAEAVANGVEFTDLDTFAAASARLSYYVGVMGQELANQFEESRRAWANNCAPFYSGLTWTERLAKYAACALGAICGTFVVLVYAALLCGY